MKQLVQSLAAAFLGASALVGCSAPSEPPPEPKQSELSPAQMTPGQKFLKAKLAELDSIQRQPAFKEHGFSPDGPFSGWINRLKAEAKKVAPGPDKSITEGADALEKLALEYVFWVSFDAAKKCGEIFTVDIGESCHIKKSIEDKTTEIRRLINEPQAKG